MLLGSMLFFVNIDEIPNQFNDLQFFFVKIGCLGITDVDKKQHSVKLRGLVILGDDIVGVAVSIFFAGCYVEW